MGDKRVARIALHAPSGPKLAATLGAAGRDPQRVNSHLGTLRWPLRVREQQSAAFLAQSSESPTARTSSAAVPTRTAGPRTTMPATRNSCLPSIGLRLSTVLDCTLTTCSPAKTPGRR